MKVTRLNSNGDVLIEIAGHTETIPGAHWASVICQASRDGEENGRWYRACAFHQGDGSVLPEDKVQPIK